LLRIDPDDGTRGHCPRALLDPVAQLAVEHGEQRQDKVGLSEARPLVVDTDEDLGNVLLRDMDTAFDNESKLARAETLVAIGSLNRKQGRRPATLRSIFGSDPPPDHFEEEIEAEQLLVTFRACPRIL
jgi:hypothetical protein